MISVSFWKDKRVLITGNTGFKGSWLSLWLRQLGSDVWGYALPSESNSSLFTSLERYCFDPSSSRITFGDIRNLELLSSVVSEASPDVIFHLAAQPLVRKSYKFPVETWETNVIGSLNVLEALRNIQHKCAVVMITTDKVYENREWTYGYRESDPLGGHDPYSSSKAAAEIAINSWRRSFVGEAAHQTPHLRIATARSGNVVGGGDWADDRIVPDIVRALLSSRPLCVRNPHATRPWQHVLEPLSGYMKLAENLLLSDKPFCEPFNFGPELNSNKSVFQLISMVNHYWPGLVVEVPEKNDDPHEANLLHLQIDKACQLLKWKPKWDFETTIEKTTYWYRNSHLGCDPIESCLYDIDAYNS